MSRELKIFSAFVGAFLVAFHLPLSSPKVTGAIVEAFKLLQWYARNHTLACVVPALFIAGGIATFLSKQAVLKHLGPTANRVEAYSVASVSGTVLAVCSCSVLPMFAGIYRIGAGLGPASAFLYSGPALNILAIFLTARVLGLRFVAKSMKGGKPPTVEASEFKLYATQLSQRAANVALDIMGAAGQLRVDTEDAPLQGRFEGTYRCTVVETIGGGASEIQKNIIARRGLRLPKNF